MSYTDRAPTTTADVPLLYNDSAPTIPADVLLSYNRILHDDMWNFVKNHDGSGLSRLLRDNPYINTNDIRDGMTPLHYCCMSAPRNSDQEVHLLRVISTLKQHTTTNVNTVDAFYRTPLYLACRSLWLNAVLVLVSGSDVMTDGVVTPSLSIDSGVMVGIKDVLNMNCIQSLLAAYRSPNARMNLMKLTEGQVNEFKRNLTYVVDVLAMAYRRELERCGVLGPNDGLIVENGEGGEDTVRCRIEYKTPGNSYMHSTYI